MLMFFWGGDDLLVRASALRYFVSRATGIWVLLPQHSVPGKYYSTHTIDVRVLKPRLIDWVDTV